MMLDVCDRQIVIVGGGRVAARKVVGLLEAGATRVRCVAPRFSDGMPAGIERVAAMYNAKHLRGAGLVFAATNEASVNDQVVRDAHAMGLLVCRADAREDEPGDFITPAKLARGPVVIGVSAGSAALSAALRDDLGRRIDSRFVRMAEAMQTLRPAVLASPLDSSARAEIFRELAGAAALEALDSGGIEALRDWLFSRHPELKHA